MQNKRPLRLLFFTPYGGRTGSEMFLWYMFSNTSKNTTEICLISDCNGELLDVMPENVKTFLSLKYPNTFTRLIKIAVRILGFNLYERHILNISKKFKADYWYLNTVLMTDKLSLAKKNNIPIIIHFHELTSDYALVTREQLQLAIDYSSLFIAGSEAISDKLKQLGAKNVVKQYACIDLSKIKPDAVKTQKLKEELGLTGYSYIWLMSGSSISRKGVDMVPALAKLLKEQGAALIWIGNNSDTGMDLMLEKEIEYNKLDNVRFLGKRMDDYYDYMNIMDGFVLTSREEPFGLVVVEALALGRPVVSFNAGGVSEILTAETGVTVDSWNIKDLADTMFNVASGIIKLSPDKAKKRAMDFDVSVQVKNWSAILLSLHK